MFSFIIIWKELCSCYSLLQYDDKGPVRFLVMNIWFLSLQDYNLIMTQDICGWGGVQGSRQVRIFEITPKSVYPSYYFQMFIMFQDKIVSRFCYFVTSDSKLKIKRSITRPINKVTLRYLVFFISSFLLPSECLKTCPYYTGHRRWTPYKGVGQRRRTRKTKIIRSGIFRSQRYYL